MCVAWTRLADIDVTESEERGGNRAVPLSLSLSLFLPLAVPMAESEEDQVCGVVGSRNGEK
jgi:hypothetical protein